MPMPLQETQQDLARQAQKAGIPRSETEQEMMMGRAKDRAAGIGVVAAHRAGAHSAVQQPGQRRVSRLDPVQR